MSPNLQASFWQRMGLKDDDRHVCITAVEDVYGVCKVEECPDQGYCSFTLLVSSAHLSKIVQIRPSQHSLDTTIARAAQKIYGRFAPMSVRYLECALPGGLKAFEMDMLRGVPVSSLRPQSPGMDLESWKKQVILVESFASFVGRAWPSSPSPKNHSRHVRADSSMFDRPSWLAQCRGKIGEDIVSRLEKLVRLLPDLALRERARDTLDRLMSMAEYPVVLNHGDLIPTNILVDEETLGIVGVVDWTEAEWLPFGTCLYGLEHLLGSLDHSSLLPRFQYYEGADMLREMFWQKLVENKPDIKRRLGDVKVMSDVGVLLWSGYAWDEGKIDRVVNEVDDAEELACLRAFLGVEYQ